MKLVGRILLAAHTFALGFHLLGFIEQQSGEENWIDINELSEKVLIFMAEGGGENLIINISIDYYLYGIIICHRNLSKIIISYYLSDLS